MQDIRDTMEPENLPVSKFPWALLLLIVLLVLLAAFLYRRRQPPARIETPEEAARRRLEALGAIAEPQVFYTELAAIFNRYLETRLDLDATRLTSVEITRAFERIGVMSTSWQESLEKLLVECDRGKFSEDPRANWNRTAAIARASRAIDLLAANVASSRRLLNPWERLGKPGNRDAGS